MSATSTGVRFRRTPDRRDCEFERLAALREIRRFATGETARPGRPSSHLRKSSSIRTRRRRERRRCWCSPASFRPRRDGPVPRPWRSRFSFAFSTDARDASRSTTTRRATRASPWRAWRASSSAWRVSQPRANHPCGSRVLRPADGRLPSTRPPATSSPLAGGKGGFGFQPPAPPPGTPPRATSTRAEISAAAACGTSTASRRSGIRRARGGTRTRSRRVTTHQQRGKPDQT